MRGNLEIEFYTNEAGMVGTLEAPSYVSDELDGIVAFVDVRGNVKSYAGGAGLQTTEEERDVVERFALTIGTISDTIAVFSLEDSCRGVASQLDVKPKKVRKTLRGMMKRGISLMFWVPNPTADESE